MGDTTTPDLGLVKPEVGASRSTWGTKWNGNADIIDNGFVALQNEIVTLQGQVATLQSQVASAQDQVPVGMIFPWAATTFPPANYLACNGQTVAIATFPALFAILGTYYGGDGTINFNVPDFRGCVLAMLDEGTGRLQGLITPDAPGVIGGGASIALDETNMPAHQHGGTTRVSGNHTHGYTTYSLPGGAGFQVGSGAQFVAGSSQTDGAGDHTHDFATDFHGGGLPHANIQPTALVYWIIKGS